MCLKKYNHTRKYIITSVGESRDVICVIYSFSASNVKNNLLLKSRLNLAKTFSAGFSSGE